MGKTRFNGLCAFTGSTKDFDARCEVYLRNVMSGTKKATTKACQDILQMSNDNVPVDTGTLQSSGFYRVTLRGDVKSYVYEGVVGYGGNGDPVNPKTGKHASEYMLEVHEDLSVPHRNGSAKFLEKAVKDYAQDKFPKTVLSYMPKP